MHDKNLLQVFYLGGDQVHECVGNSRRSASRSAMRASSCEGTIEIEEAIEGSRRAVTIELIEALPL